MKKLALMLLMLMLMMAVAACYSVSAENAGQTNNMTENKTEAGVTENMDKKVIKVKISVNGKELIANMEDNATTRAFIEKMPLELPMQDLYGREMCYRYGQGGLPVEKTRTDGYTVGDIAYWPPRGSLVILYSQNGEHFERQQLGHITDGVEIFKSTGDTKVKFELIK